MKVRIGNSQDFIEQEFETKEQAVNFLQTQGVVLKQALKALATAVPIAVEVAKNEETGKVEQKVNPPYQPQRTQGMDTEVCPKCGQKTLYTNATKAERPDGSPNPNAGKLYKKCKCGYYDPYQTKKVGGYHGK